MAKGKKKTKGLFSSKKKEEAWESKHGKSEGWEHGKAAGPHSMTAGAEKSGKKFGKKFKK